MDRFEEAFIQCLKDGVYPGPANINERYRADKRRFNRLNGEKTKERLALMHAFGIPYQRGHTSYKWDNDKKMYVIADTTKGAVPEYPYLLNPFDENDKEPEPGYRKQEIQDPNELWKLRRK